MRCPTRPKITIVGAAVALLSLASSSGSALLAAQPGDGQVAWSWESVEGAVAYDLTGSDGVTVRTTDTTVTLPAANGVSTVQTLTATAIDGTVLATDMLGAAGADVTAPDTRGVLASFWRGEGGGVLAQVTVPSSVSDVDHVRVTLGGVLYGTQPVAPGQTVQFTVASADTHGAGVQWIGLALSDALGNVSALVGAASGTHGRTGEYRTPPPPVGVRATACTSDGAVVALDQPGGANAFVVYRHDMATGVTDGSAVARSHTPEVTLPTGTFVARAFDQVASIASAPFVVASEDGACEAAATGPVWEGAAAAVAAPGPTMAQVVAEGSRHVAPLVVTAVDPDAGTGNATLDTRLGWARRSAARTLAAVEVLHDGVVVRAQGLAGADARSVTVPVDPTWTGDVQVRWVDLLGRRGPLAQVSLPAAPAAGTGAPTIEDASIDGDTLRLSVGSLASGASALEVLVDGVAHEVAASSSVSIPLSSNAARRTVAVSVSQLRGTLAGPASAPTFVTG